jgi:tryptophan synthase alpha chain
MAMTTRIEEKFKQLKAAQQKAFIAYLTFGDPDLETSCQLVLALEKAGVDIVELGVPFSDPVADGPVIQRGAERALRQGFTLKKALGAIAELRKQSQLPFLLFSYFNPLYAYGFQSLVRDARQSGLDGFLITDLSVEEAKAPAGIVGDAGLNMVFLAAPTSTEERIQKIARFSSGFIYAVSRTGVTGEQSSLSNSAAPLLERIRRHTHLPVAVGFGISTPEQVRQVQAFADGAVVGSAMVRCIEENLGTPDLPSKLEQYARWLQGGS